MSHHRILVLGLLTLAGVMLLLSSPAHANNTVRYVATTGSDSGDCIAPGSPCRTLQYAADQASAGDTIKVAQGTYTDLHARAGVTQTVYIAQSLTLQGGYTTTNGFAGPPDPATYPTILDAQGLGRVVYITREVTATLDGLRILNGAGDRGGGGPPVGSGGGIWSDARALTIRNSTIMSNTAHSAGPSSVSEGGGIYQGCAVIAGYCSYTPTLVVENSRIVSNTADYDGGGIYASRTAITLQDVELTGNRSGENGGGLCSYEGPLTVLDSDLINNTAGDDDSYDSNNGGGLYAYGGGTVILEDNTFASNTAVGFAGGAYVRETTLTMTQNLVQDNASQMYGGGAYAYDCAAYAAHNTFERNTAEAAGGGLGASEGTLVLTHNSFLNNTGGTHGGGGFQGSVGAGQAYEVTYNLFQDNVGYRHGGAAGGGANISGGDGWVVFSHNQVLNNEAVAGPTGTGWGLGGGAAIAGPALIADNLFQGNWANSTPPQGGYYYSGLGGGLSLMGQGLQVERNRFFNNRAARNAGINYTSLALGGGVYVSSGSTVTMTNNILAGNVFCEDCNAGELQSEWFRGGAAVAVQGPEYAPAPDTHLVLWHNTIADNQVSAIRNEGAATIAMSHNILSGHTTGLSNVRRYDYACPTTTADYTLWWPSRSVVVHDLGGQCDAPATTHDFTGNPGFTSTPLDNYHLGPASQAINQGPGVGVSDDIDGNPRPIGAGYDLGADEYVTVDLSPSTKSANPQDAAIGEQVTFTIALRNSGTASSPNTRLFDAIPAGTTYVPGSAQATAGTVTDAGSIGWTGVVAPNTPVTVSFRVTVNQVTIIQNTAVITDGYGTVWHRQAWVNAPRLYLPLVLRQ
ncbi:MAG: DUF11 domain-containing protein [Chloroflexi bacterium]|nr:DUF11 domain-containing protein [Chloroflexota bacterium]MBU1751315.1 DUF11 domain-containing protein [Chloroflexota bacterium]